MSRLKRLILNILLFPVFGAFGSYAVYTNTNKKADAAELVNIFYDKTALKEGKPFNRLEQFAVKSRNIPQGAGDEIDWWKTVPIAVASDYGVLTEGESPAATKLNWQRVKALVKGYGLVVSMSEFLEIISIDPKMQSTAASLGIHREKTINRMYWGCLAQNLYPMRIDGNGTYEKLITGVADGSSTTVVESANLSGTNSKWVGGVIVMTSGNNFGMGGYISASNQGDTDVDISTTAPSYALNEAVADGDLGKIAATDGLDSDNPLDCAGVAKSIVILQTNLTTPYEDSYFVGMLSPFTQFDIRNDSEWVNADHYSGSKKLYNGEIGEWGGVRFVLDSLPWRTVAGTMGTYDSAGEVFHTPIFGKDCFAGVRFNGVQDKLIKKTKEQTGDPLETYSTIGWKAYLVPKVLHATFGVQILSGATSII